MKINGQIKSSNKTYRLTSIKTTHKNSIENYNSHKLLLYHTATDKSRSTSAYLVYNINNEHILNTTTMVSDKENL